LFYFGNPGNYFLYSCTQVLEPFVLFVPVMLHAILYLIIINTAGGKFLLCDQQFMIVTGCSLNLTAQGFIQVSDLRDGEISLKLQTPKCVPMGMILSLFRKRRIESFLDYHTLLVVTTDRVRPIRFWDVKDSKFS
jgi:hypothetical protein